MNCTRHIRQYHSFLNQGDIKDLITFLTQYVIYINVHEVYNLDKFRIQ